MKRRYRPLLLALGLTCFATALRADKVPMSAPDMNDARKPWNYFGKTTTLIGVPFMPDAIQVTFDGALFTRSAELCFFLGDPPRPFFDRQKQWADGWIPIVQARDEQDGIRCELEMFTAIPDSDEQTANTLQLIRARLTNPTDKPARAVFTAAARGSGEDYRLGGVSFGPTTRFEMTGDTLLRDGKAIYAFPPGRDGGPRLLPRCASEGGQASPSGAAARKGLRALPMRYAVPGVAYERPFVAHEYQVTPRTEAGLVRYERELKPGEGWDLVFRMPRVPSEAIPAADWDKERAKCVEYWTGLTGTRCRISLPEPRLEQAHRAAAAHVLLGTRTQGNGKTQTDGLPYPMLFIICLWDYQMLYDSLGLGEFYEVNLPHLRRLQLDDGMFLDTSLTHGARIMSSHGPTLFSLTHHVVMTRDMAFATNVWPMVQRAVTCIRSDCEKDPHGLLRPSTPYDAEMIKGYYASHNYWALAALRSAIRAARLTGHDDAAKAWLAFHDRYEKDVQKAIDASARPDGYLPTGFYDFITGPAARGGFGEYQTDQDYDNLMTAWPTEALRPDDPRVMATFRTVHDLRYREGIMTYRNGQHLHQYATVKNTMQALVAGQDREFLRDLYHILAHSGSTHESFENLIVPWTTRTPEAGCPPPHVWGASKMYECLRSMVIMEYGGRGGLDADQRELRLFNAIPAGWAKPGQTASVANALTEFGTVSAELAFRADGADLTVNADFHTPPSRIVLRVPYWAEAVTIHDCVFEASSVATAPWPAEPSERRRLSGSAESAPRQSGATTVAATVSDGWIYLPATTRSARLDWKPKPGVHDGTYQGLLTDYRRERGFWSGKRSEAPPMKTAVLSSAERAAPAEPLSLDLVTRALTHEFECRYAATGKPWPIAAPPMQTAAERQARFKAAHGSWDPAETGIAVGKPATASRTDGDYQPSRAVDGDAGNLQSSWQADPYPQWWQVDLGKVTSVNRIHVFPYWGVGRYYKYTVEVSKDGKAWQRIADMSENTTPSTPAGNDFRFQPVEARFVRVNMLYHSLNPGVHLVEVRVFPTRNQ